jgi:glycosyltransferase 2 family protein
MQKNVASGPDPSNMKSTVISWRSLRVVIAACLLLFLATQVNLSYTLDVLANAEWRHLVTVLALLFLTRLLAAYRWYALLKHVDRTVAFGNILRLVFVSGFVGYFMPGTLGIEALRIYGFARTTANPALAVASVAVDRLLGTFALILLALSGLALLPAALPAGVAPDALPDGLATVGWIGLLALVALVVAGLEPRLRRLALHLLSRWARVQDGVRKVFGILDAYRARPVALLWNAVVAVGFHLLRCAAVGVGAAAFGVELPWMVYVAITPLITMLARIPISIAGLGVQEAGFVYLYGIFGMPAEVALVLSLVMRACTILSSAPGAWFYVVRGVRA